MKSIDSIVNVFKVDCGNLKGDFFGGITAGIITLEDGDRADPLALLDATRARRRAEEQLLAVVDAMSAVAPAPELP